MAVGAPGRACVLWPCCAWWPGSRAQWGLPSPSCLTSWSASATPNVPSSPGPAQLHPAPPHTCKPGCGRWADRHRLGWLQPGWWSREGAPGESLLHLGTLHVCSHLPWAVARWVMTPQEEGRLAVLPPRPVSACLGPSEPSAVSPGCEAEDTGDGATAEVLGPLLPVFSPLLPPLHRWPGREWRGQPGCCPRVAAGSVQCPLGCLLLNSQEVPALHPHTPAGWRGLGVPCGRRLGEWMFGEGKGGEGQSLFLCLWLPWSLAVPLGSGGAGRLARGLGRSCELWAGAWGALGQWTELTAWQAHPLVVIEVLILGAVVAA